MTIVRTSLPANCQICCNSTCLNACINDKKAKRVLVYVNNWEAGPQSASNNCDCPNWGNAGHIVAELSSLGCQYLTTYMHTKAVCDPAGSNYGIVTISISIGNLSPTLTRVYCEILLQLNVGGANQYTRWFSDFPKPFDCANMDVTLAFYEQLYGTFPYTYSPYYCDGNGSIQSTLRVKAI